MKNEELIRRLQPAVAEYGFVYNRKAMGIWKQRNETR